MDTTKGTTQTSRSFVNTTDIDNNAIYYVTKFVSPALNQTGISANTWRYNFSTKHSNLSVIDDFPTPDSTSTVPVACYVWRPSNGTKVGNILDGNTGTGYYDSGAFHSSPGGTINQISQDGTFTGAAVAGAAVGDVIILEAWVSVWPVSTVSVTLQYFYDGAVETLTDGTTVSNHASFIETPQNLVFVSAAPIDMTQVAAKTYSNKFVTKV